MAVCKMCKGLLMCWVIHIVVSVEDTAVSINPKLSSAGSKSKTSDEKVELQVLGTTDKGIQDTAMNNRNDTLQYPTYSVSASNETELNTDSNAKEEDLRAKSEEEDPLDEIYRQCKGRLSCVEQRAVTLIDRLDAVKSIPMFEGYVTIEKTSEEVPEKAVTADSNAALLSRVNRYLRSHSIRVHILKTEGNVPQLLGRFLQERSVDFSLGTLATNDASEG
jgi:hypothetical protein